MSKLSSIIFKVTYDDSSMTLILKHFDTLYHHGRLIFWKAKKKINSIIAHIIHIFVGACRKSDKRFTIK